MWTKLGKLKSRKLAVVVGAIGAILGLEGVSEHTQTLVAGLAGVYAAAQGFADAWASRK